jgi:hypothetical protein
MKQRVATIMRLAVVLALAAMPAVAQQELQLDENCVVSILNRNAVVSHEGTWLVPNVPAGFGLVRARATCVRGGLTIAGESTLFNVLANQGVDVPPILLGSTTPIPQLITVSTAMTTLATAGATTQLIVNGVYAGNISHNITPSSTGTKYLVSNPAIATVTSEGLVTAVTTGTAIVQAQNEGASGLIAIRVALSADSDGDGIPDDVEIREGLNPNNPADALEDADHDGLSNLEEFNRGTQMHNPDSDGDGILDGEEVIAGVDGFITNPLSADTDGDGIRDGLEVQSGSDPTNPASINLARALRDVRIAPATFTLIVNLIIGEASTQLTVTGDLLDGTTIDLTSTARGTNYTSSDLNVCNFGAQPGRVFAASDGPCTITALNSGFSAQVTGSVRTFRPAALSMLQMPGYANNVDVSQGYAYVAAGSAGLVVVSVSDPLHPAIVATRDTPGNADDVRIVGRYAYVADGPSGLQIIDIVDPSAPVIVGSVDTPGDASDVMIANNIAFIADGGAGLVIADVSSPTSPIIVGSIRTGGTARGVDVSGNYALVADDSPLPGLRVINVANPANPQMVGSVSLNDGSPKDVRASGNIAVVAQYTGGVAVVDFSTPSAPQRIGGLPGAAPTGFVPRDVELAGQFAIFAEQLFPNAVPFVDITHPSVPVLKGIIDFEPMADYAGTGIAVAGPFVYMTGENFVVSNDNGTTGNTRLFIGQYLPQEDLAGVPPQVSITSPQNGSTIFEGTPLAVTATATDDVVVAAVVFSIDGQDVFTDTSAPYEYTFDVPTGVSSMTIRATAFDLGNNSASAQTTFSIVPDPLTTVSGIVIDQNGVPLVGANVTTVNDLSATTGPGGEFSIFSVPTVRGNLIATAHYTTADGTLLAGSSAPAAPVRSGVTNVGTITAVSATWEPNYGTYLTNCDDCAYTRTLPFSFTYYGVTYTTVYVGTNGYLTFNNGDGTYVESLPAFNSLPRIAPFFDDLFGRNTGAVYVNDQLPGRFVVTYNTVQHYNYGGSNTIQVILFADGRIQFGYQGITALTTGTITGITPGPNSPFQAVNYSDQRNVDVPAGTSIYEYFTNTNPFDIDNGFALFTPRTGGGYNMRSILPAAVGGSLQLNGSPAGTAAVIAAQSTRTPKEVNVQAQNVFAKAEVEVRSSGDVKYRGMTNTDHRGVFTLRNVPPGGISVTLRHKGEIVGTAAGVWLPETGKAKTLNLEVKSVIQDVKPQGNQ